MEIGEREREREKKGEVVEITGVKDLLLTATKQGLSVFPSLRRHLTLLLGYGGVIF